MRVLGCLDGTNAEVIGNAVQMFTTSEPLRIGLLTVIDSGPREEMDRMRERFWRSPIHHKPAPQEHPPHHEAHQPPPHERAAAEAPAPPPIRGLTNPMNERMREAESASAEETLREGLNYVQGAEGLTRQGRPELEIVNAAAEWKADVIVVCARAIYGEPAHVGPKSVGHVARFVLDHAPCPVLLVRPMAHEQFPIDR